jgi:alanine racemase
MDVKTIRPVWAEVDLDCLAHNMREARRAARPGASVCAAVKADAYGHGAARVADTLLQNGADRLAVALLDEGIALREAGVQAPILVLGLPETARADEIARYRLDQTVASHDAAKPLSDAGVRGGAPISVHIKADTGMGRIGMPCGAAALDEAAVREVLAIRQLPGVAVEGIFTHFAVADEPDPESAAYVRVQLGKFLALCGALAARGLRIPIRHCANSAALLHYPETHLDMVRPGILLYGMAAAPGDFPPRPDLPNLSLRQALSLKARVAQVKEIPRGASVGYGRRFVAARPSAIATLPLGYGDGYNRLLSCGVGEVLIGGRRAPIAGRICMDQCMVDVTGIGGVRAGDEAVLIGRQGDDFIALAELAQKLHTINYEVLCAINRRVPRVYKKQFAE